MKLVIALGGNALLRRDQAQTAGNQLANIKVAATQLARLAADHTLIVTHGNGPQVGLLALQAAAYTAVPPYPLDVLGAQTEGMIGYLLEQELGNQLPASSVVVTLLTRVEVNAEDPAFRHPVKPIGPVYSQQAAEEIQKIQVWAMVAEGKGMRRVVASPPPLRVLGLEPIRWLLERGAVVIAAGGGGIPVARHTTTDPWHGVEAVIDKDLCSGLLAHEIEADCLVIVTDVPGVYLDWGQTGQRLIGKVTPDTLATHDFAAGSMAPKVEAACAFVRATGRRAVIGALDQIGEMLAGHAGTQVCAAAAGSREA